MGKKVAPGDERNASFELAESELEDHKPGFDPGERDAKRATMAGSDAFPRRSDEKSIPKGLIADRIRETHGKGA